MTDFGDYIIFLVILLIFCVISFIITIIGLSYYLYNYSDNFANMLWNTYFYFNFNHGISIKFLYNRDIFISFLIISAIGFLFPAIIVVLLLSLSMTVSIIVVPFKLLKLFLFKIINNYINQNINKIVNKINEKQKDEESLLLKLNEKKEIIDELQNKVNSIPNDVNVGYRKNRGKL